jgi:thioredoxin reductase (NADPH)
MPTKPEENTPQPGQNWFLPDKSREQLKTIFAALENPVNIHVFTLPGENDPFNDFILKFLADLERISPKIIVHRRRPGDEEAQKWGVTNSPCLLIEPELYKMRFVGAPIGEEGRSFIEGVLMASKRDSGLSQESREELAKLDQPRTVKVFVSPTCPFCPAQVVNAFRAAVERPDLITAWSVEIGQMFELADRYGVGSVPHTLFNEKLTVLGLEQEHRFVSELITLKDSLNVMAVHHKPGEVLKVDLLILGAGPAGLTAGIYAGRAGLKTLILEKEGIGGQVTITPVVENYPGFTNIPGITLMEVTAAQARQYSEIIMEEPTSLSAGENGVWARTVSYDIEAKALLIATGATWKKLDVPGEVEFFGHGVNYCATCDGYLYKDRKVLVVGGGNTALTNALYLKNLGVKVDLVHRRDQFRGEQYLQDSVRRENIPLHLNTLVEAVIGDTKVRAAKVRDIKSGQVQEIPTDGIFVSIGETANSQPAARIGCELTPEGNIKVDEHLRTNVPSVYAAGDVTGGGGIRQIITAVGQGGQAAMAIFEDLAKQKAL